MKFSHETADAFAECPQCGDVWSGGKYCPTCQDSGSVRRGSLPTDMLPPVPVVITDRVFALAALATLLVALALASGFGWLAFGLMREVLATREALEESQGRAAICESQLLRSDAKLEQTNELFDAVGGRRRGIGGGP